MLITWLENVNVTQLVAIISFIGFRR